jgi:hypothetical protein
VREKHIKNREVRAMFYNIPNVDTFIDKRVAKYISKTARSSNTNLPKKFLAAWINKARKPGGPQLTCNNIEEEDDVSPCTLGTSLKSRPYVVPCVVFFSVVQRQVV